MWEWICSDVEKIDGQSIFGTYAFILQYDNNCWFKNLLHALFSLFLNLIAELSSIASSLGRRARIMGKKGELSKVVDATPEDSDETDIE